MEPSAEPDTCISVLIFPVQCLQFLNEAKREDGLRAVSIPLNTHWNANQKPIRSPPGYRAQCTLCIPANLPDPPLSIFQGSGSETISQWGKGGRVEEGRKGRRRKEEGGCGLVGPG